MTPDNETIQKLILNREFSCKGYLKLKTNCKYLDFFFENK